MAGNRSNAEDEIEDNITSQENNDKNIYADEEIIEDVDSGMLSVAYELFRTRPSTLHSPIK